MKALAFAFTALVIAGTAFAAGKPGPATIHLPRGGRTLEGVRVTYPGEPCHEEGGALTLRGVRVSVDTDRRNATNNTKYGFREEPPGFAHVTAPDGESVTVPLTADGVIRIRIGAR